MLFVVNTNVVEEDDRIVGFVKSCVGELAYFSMFNTCAACRNETNSLPYCVMIGDPILASVGFRVRKYPKYP